MTNDDRHDWRCGGKQADSANHFQLALAVEKRDRPEKYGQEQKRGVEQQVAPNQMRLHAQRNLHFGDRRDGGEVARLAGWVALAVVFALALEMLGAEMEMEAQQRYGELADMMEVHNNPEVMTLFRKMSVIEGKHAKQIMEEMGWTEAPANAVAPNPVTNREFSRFV